MWWVLPVLTGITIATFFYMLLFEETRANILAELWGVAGAGTVAWWFLEHYSEPIQQGAWLKRHARELDRVVGHVRYEAAASAIKALDFTDELADELLKYPVTEGLEAKLPLAR